MLREHKLFIHCHWLCYLAKVVSNDGRGGIVVRTHASRAEGLRLEPDSMPWLNARSLFTQQQMGTWWQHWRDKGSEERNWPPYQTSRWLRISFLSNRHSPTYESIWRDLSLLYWMMNLASTILLWYTNAKHEMRCSKWFFLSKLVAQSLWMENCLSHIHCKHLKYHFIEFEIAQLIIACNLVEPLLSLIHIFSTVYKNRIFSNASCFISICFLYIYMFSLYLFYYLLLFYSFDFFKLLDFKCSWFDKNKICQYMLSIIFFIGSAYKYAFILENYNRFEQTVAVYTLQAFSSKEKVMNLILHSIYIYLWKYFTYKYTYIHQGSYSQGIFEVLRIREPFQ